WLHDPQLRAERRDLLTRDHALLPDPLVEPVLPYQRDVPATEAAKRAGLSQSMAETLIGGVFGTDEPNSVLLGAHQAEAMQVALGRFHHVNPVVSTGTGSGKTEAFLLPVLGRLLHESQRWPNPQVPRWWWEDPGAGWTPIRGAERPAAVRSMVLYPTNALVEDQIVRLRRAIRGIRERGGPSLWFGRYTSASPGGTRMPGPRGGGSAGSVPVREIGVDLRNLSSE